MALRRQGQEGVPPTLAAPAVTVRGVLIGRFITADGRSPASREKVAQILSTFEPNTVPILEGHGGRPIGYLDTLEAWDTFGLDLAFTGHVSPYPDLIEQLRRGVAVSSEKWGPPGVELSGPGTGSWPMEHYRGQRGEGWTLTGVACLLNGELPAAAGSYMALAVTA